MTDPQSHENDTSVTAGATEQQDLTAATATAETTETPEAAADDESETTGELSEDRRGLFGLQSFLNVLVVVIFVITFVVQAFRVPSESMENTLLVGDFILADKLHFAADGGLWHMILPYRPVRHGDPSQFFVKRVIGLPGDHIHLSGGVVYLNGKPLEESYVIHSFPFPNFYRDNFPMEGYISPETNRKWRRQMPDHVKDGELVVPPDSYFVMGDNRDRSLDSRYWGFVPRDNIMGRPLVIYMSLNEGDDAGARTVGGKLVHSGHMLAHFLQLARWGRVFHLVR